MDPDAGVWTIPAARMTAKPDHCLRLRGCRAFGELGDGRAHLGKVSKDPAVDGLLLERAIPALDDPVGFRLFNEAEAGVDAPVPKLVEEVADRYWLPLSIRTASPRPTSASTAP